MIVNPGKILFEGDSISLESSVFEGVSSMSEILEDVRSHINSMIDDAIKDFDSGPMIGMPTGENLNWEFTDGKPAESTE